MADTPSYYKSAYTGRQMESLLTGIFEGDGNFGRIIDQTTKEVYGVRVLSQADYNTLVAAGTLDDYTLYFVREEDL